MLTYSSDASGDLIGVAPGTSAPPEITGQPVDQLVSAGDFASFSVVVANTSGVTFQWAFNGTDIAGATGDSLLLPAAGAANVGQYTVTVTNSVGSVTSSPATLALDSGVSTASSRPRLTAYSDAGGSVTVTPFRRGNDYDVGETITLTATPSAPSMFVGWSGITTGDLLATTNPAIVRLTVGDTTVRARFASVVPLAGGMVGFWRGETDATDLIGGHSGTFHIGSTPTTPSVTAWGKVGRAFDFQGQVHVQVPDAAALKPAQMTAEAWVFPTVASGFNSVIARGSSTNTDDTWYLGVTSGIPQFFSHGQNLVAAPSAIPMNEWTHLAITFDGTTKRLYVNGAQVASQSGLGGLVYDPAPVPVTIGADFTANAPSDFFNGLVDEVSLYNRALSCDEVFDIYNADLVGRNVTAPYFTTNSPLPVAAANTTGYTQQLSTVLSTAPVSFTLSDGALPPGMTLSSTGAVSGVLNVPGVFDFTVAATDASGNATEQLYMLTVALPVVPPPGLIGWWRGEPTSSATVQDSINGNNGGFFTGTTAAAPSYTTDGKVGGAFAFNGSTYVQIPDAAALKPAQMTAEAWVFPTVASGFNSVIAHGSSTNTDDTWYLGVTSGIPQFFSHGSNLVAAPNAIPMNQWTHLAITFDGTTKRLYVNGAQVASQGGHGGLVYDPAPIPVTIGADWTRNAPSDFFNGLVDEVSLYARALTPAEISGIVAAGPAGKSTVGPYITTEPLLQDAIVGQLYTQTFTSVRGTPPVSYALTSASVAPPGLTLTSAGVLSGTPTVADVFEFTVVATDAAMLSDQQPCTLQAYQSVIAPAGMVGWWRGEPTSSATVLDSINGNNGGFFTGTTAAAPSYTTDGEVGGAFAFNGSTYVQIPDMAALKPAQMTAEAWVFPTFGSGFNAVIARGSSTNTDDTWYLGVTSGTPQFFSHGQNLLAAPNAIPMNEWTHLAITFDGTTKRLYVNGAQVASRGGLGAFVYDPAPVPVTIGADFTANAPSDFFNGLVDEVSLYNRALTPAEVSGIVAAGPAGKST